VTIPGSLIIAAVLGVAGSAVSMPDMGVHAVRFIVSTAFSMVVNWIYEASLESSSYQATLGKMALGLKVTDLEGRRISFARATGRHFAKILSGMILLIGYIIAGFSTRKQALHDMIAGTLVVRSHWFLCKAFHHRDTESQRKLQRKHLQKTLFPRGDTEARRKLNLCVSSDPRNLPSITFGRRVAT
jgi:uncharacterized RDD family membrane protein YckC